MICVLPLGVINDDDNDDIGEVNVRILARVIHTKTTFTFGDREWL